MTDLLKRGTPVIINDADAPETRLVAVLKHFNSTKGVWYAEYLSTYPRLKLCYTDRRPTPLSEFGVKLEWSPSGPHLPLRADRRGHHSQVPRRSAAALAGAPPGHALGSARAGGPARP